ncbi:MAG: MFS transporter, partial [Proteobacteria bacterium]|nr:MFS transporter [Pseudomonadota bacterium]
VMVVVSLVYALAASPAERAADRGEGARLLSAGMLALVASDVVLALVGGAGGAMTGAALWGLHMALTQGLLAALVAGTAPANLRGTAFGVFNLLSGIGLLAASALAGELWQAFGPSATFLTGAGLTVAAWVAFRASGRYLPRLDGGG